MKKRQSSQVHLTADQRSWTDEEEKYLRQHSTDGAKLVAYVLRRPITSVQKKASRMGISLRKVPRVGICPRCGVHRITPNTLAAGYGLCLVCWEREKADMMEERAAELREKRRYDAAKKAVRKEQRHG